MTMTGTVRNGVIVPDRPGDLIEGTVVEISVTGQPPTARPNARLVEWLRQRSPMNPEQAADWRRAIAEVLARREDDVALQEQVQKHRSNGQKP